MPVTYAIPQPTPGTSRAASPTETEILIDVSDTIADVGGRLDTLEGAALNHMQVNPTEGSTAINTGSAWANLSTHIVSFADITMPAAAGDVLGVYLGGRWGNELFFGKLDIATIVSGSIVNLLSSGGASPGAEGVPAWFGNGTGTANYEGFGGWAFYAVQAGDVSGGNVTLRPRVLTTGAKEVFVSAGSFVAINFGAI